jgi:pyruvate/2-oxoglutarate/acetoin dehydrogenase E1 component
MDSLVNPYRAALCAAMAELGQRDNAVFLGQAVRYPGTAMYGTLGDVPMEKRIEMPVAENFQLGLSTGLALCGFLPVSIFPRINFLLEAMSQLIQHLDALPLYGNGYRPRVLIRTAIAHDRPMDPGIQHLGNFAPAIRMLCRTIRVVELDHAEEIVPAYRAAAEADHSTILAERAALYDQ